MLAARGSTAGSPDRPRRLHDGALPRLPAPQRDRRRRRRLPRRRTAGSTSPPTTRRWATSRCGTPSARRTSCSSCSRPTSPATWRSRSWPTRAAAAGCRDGRSPASETNVMTGDPVTPFLVENWSAGLLAGHEQEAYRALRANALRRAAGSLAGRAAAPAIRCYARRGYIASGLKCPRKGGPTPTAAAGLGDARVRRRGRVARADGARAGPRRRRPAARPPRRGYPHAVEPAARGCSSRAGATGAGSRRTTRARAPASSTRAAPYQYQLARPAGPRRTRAPARRTAAAASRELDASSPTAALLRDPVSDRRAALGRAPATTTTAPSTYNPNNEPDLHAPYLYAWTGPAVEDGDRRPRRRDAVHERAGGHDGQRRPRHRVGLVRAQLARPVSHDERRRLLRR